MMMFDGTQVMAMFQQFLEAQNHQAVQFRATVMDVLRTREPAAPAPVAPPAPAAPRPGTAKEYQNLCPMDFWGDEGIVYADEWLENAERTLRMANIPDDTKVEVASMRLFDLARAWYREDPQLAESHVSWIDFKTLFKEKFFPEVERDELRMQFEVLQQGTMTVAEYTSEFTRLNRFAESLVRAPEDRAWRFKKGLTRELQHAVAISQATTYSSILKIVQAVEKEMDLRPKRDRDIGSSSHQAPTKRVQIQTQTRPVQQAVVQHRPARVHADPPQRQQLAVTCNYCHRPGHHYDECRKRLRLCLFCGSPAHHVRDCPEAAEGRARVAPGPQQVDLPLHVQQPQGDQPEGRVYLMTAEEVETIPIPDEY
ncbi:uncharacterized protein M6B38_157475 [Iris pallida]|uniref:CCHC-type domain-containing protein n=1 Tax=Iris pallida TaxID=29817 RepID=A0AAX6F0W5_IRIPA|nr:uncharacterized protein M6B38_157475 [Iris pallida]